MSSAQGIGWTSIFGTVIERTVFLTLRSIGETMSLARVYERRNVAFIKQQPDATVAFFGGLISVFHCKWEGEF